PDYHAAFNGFVNDEDDTIVAGTLVCTTTGLTNLSGVGQYDITSCSGLSAPNYSVHYDLKKVTVGKKDAGVAANHKSKTYGDDNPALTATVTGAVTGGDAVNYTLATTAVKLSGVGDHPISVTLGSNPNYDVSKTDDTLSVGKKDATVSADHKEKTYGDDNPALTAT